MSKITALGITFAVFVKPVLKLSCFVSLREKVELECQNKLYLLYLSLTSFSCKAQWAAVIIFVRLIRVAPHL
jgi:hypothetical protein